MPDLDLDLEDEGPVRLTHEYTPSLISIAPTNMLIFFSGSEALREFLGIPKDGHDTADTVAAASLLFLRTHRLPPRQPSGASGDAWSTLAPDYPSR
jgi:hypothetical protein